MSGGVPGPDVREAGTEHRPDFPSVAVVVVTLDRPDCVRECLQCLGRQDPAPAQVIVVDASSGDETAEVIRCFPAVEYIRNANGVGKMTASRNIGLTRVEADLVAFVDDDSYAHDGWLAAVASSFDDGIGAVGGRALNGRDGEDVEGLDEIGKLTAEGEIKGNFAANPGRVIDVDHIIGCNMTFRRSLMGELGGFREDYGGISGVREDSDMCFRVSRHGQRIVFNPDAVVTHIGAPQARGQRFDRRYHYYTQRNHCLLLLRNFGITNPIFWRFLGATAQDVAGMCKTSRARAMAGALVTAVVRAAGTVTGTAYGLVKLIASGTEPVRRDAAGRVVTAALAPRSHSGR